MSANDNVNHIKSNIRYVSYKKIESNEIIVKYTRIHVYEYTERMFACNVSYRDRKPKYISKF